MLTNTQKGKVDFVYFYQDQEDEPAQEDRPEVDVLQHVFNFNPCQGLQACPLIAGGKTGHGGDRRPAGCRFGFFFGFFGLAVRLEEVPEAEPPVGGDKEHQTDRKPEDAVP